MHVMLLRSSSRQESPVELPDAQARWHSSKRKVQKPQRLRCKANALTHHSRDSCEPSQIRAVAVRGCIQPHSRTEEVARRQTQPAAKVCSTVLERRSCSAYRSRPSRGCDGACGPAHGMSHADVRASGRRFRAAEPVLPRRAPPSVRVAFAAARNRDQVRAYPRSRRRPRQRVGRRTRRSRGVTCRRGRFGRRGRESAAGRRAGRAWVARSRRLPTPGDASPRIRAAHRTAGRHVADDDPVAARTAELRPFASTAAGLDVEGGGLWCACGVRLEPAVGAAIHVAAIKPREASARRSGNAMARLSTVPGASAGHSN